MVLKSGTCTNLLIGICEFSWSELFGIPLAFNVLNFLRELFQSLELWKSLPV